MILIIVAGALGVIITGGLFLRRLLGELAALRQQLTEQGRQITGIDKAVRRQRAHVTLLRQLLADDGEATNTTDGDGSPPQAVVNGIGQTAPPGGPEPVRRKRHLGLYIGGAAAALVTLSEVIREAALAHRSQVVGAVTGAALSAATVSMVVIQPWTQDTQGSGYDFPRISIPPVSVPPTYAPPVVLHRPTPSEPAATSSPAPRSTASPPETAASPSPSPSGSAPALAPVGEELSAPEVSGPTGDRAAAQQPGDTADASGPPGDASPPGGGPGTSPKAPGPPEPPGPPDGPPHNGPPAERGPCAGPAPAHKANVCGGGQ